MRFPCDIFERQLAWLPLLQQRVVSIAAYLLLWRGGGDEAGFRFAGISSNPNDKNTINKFCTFIELKCL